MAKIGPRSPQTPSNPHPDDGKESKAQDLADKTRNVVVKARNIPTTIFPKEREISKDYRTPQKAIDVSKRFFNPSLPE